MRKLILSLAVSLDGYIEGPNGEYDWCFTDQNFGMSNFLNRIDSIFIGRKTYEVVVKMENRGVEAGFPNFQKYVFSNSISKPEQGVFLVQGNIREEVLRIKEQSGKDIWLFGGGELTTSLMELELVDEINLAIHPVLLRGGKPLFSSVKNRRNLDLSETETYSTGLVRLHYHLKGS